VVAARLPAGSGQVFALYLADDRSGNGVSPLVPVNG
jgi:hypothetical protein